MWHCSFKIVLASLTLALMTGVAFSEDHAESELEFAQRLLEQRSDIEPYIFRAQRDSYAIFRHDGSYIGVVDVKTGTPEEEVAKMAQVGSATKLSSGGRILLEHVGKAAAVLGEVLCDLEGIPHEVSFTAGFSAGAVLTMTITYYTADLCT